MAEEKKSFVFYSDWYGVFKEIPDDLAGKLIKHIFSYVNDENPQSDDFMINALFSQIKNTLKRDLEKWESQKKQRSDAGKRSAEKRNPTKSNDRSISFNETQRNSTVRCNMLDVSVNVNDVLLEKEPKEKKIEKKVSEDDLVKTETAEKEKSCAKKENLEMPEEFIPIWEDWIDYRKARKLKPYAGAKYEQIAVNKLLELSNKDPVTAKKILEQTYQYNYQGFFELKENYGKPISNTGTNENNTSSRQATFNIREASERLAADFETGNILGVYKK